MSEPVHPLLALYNQRLADGLLQDDSAQQGAIMVFDDLLQKLNQAPAKKAGLLARLGLMSDTSSAAIQGLYLYGDVGRGKSMLMDMFFAAVHEPLKRRVHFHQFMLEIHERLHNLQAARVDDILPHVAREIAAEARLLCFDEFHVSNIADAMILGRLFSSMFDAGVVIVATSNWPPDDLYKNGLQRDRFLPFIDVLKLHMNVYNLNGMTDHRYEQTHGIDSYFSPLGDNATRQLQGIFLQLTDDATPEQIDLPVQGRHLKIVHAAKGVGFFNFDELCGLPLGAADFLAIAGCLHTVLLDGVPRLSAEQRNETLRFMTLIDTLYEAKVKLFMAAAVPVTEILQGGEHSYAFQRTLSRLAEMQGEEYRRMPKLTIIGPTH